VIETISAALDLPDSVVCRAAQVSQRLFDDRRRRRFEVEEATLAAFMRYPTVNKQKKSSDSIVSYLRLISS
jgi:hypothetical protein